MTKESICIKVPKKQGEKALVLANKLTIINIDLMLQRDENSIYIPLRSRPQEDALRALKEQIANIEVSVYVFTEKKRKESLADLLENKLPPHLLANLPHSADFVGNIAIIEISPELEAHKAIIGEALLKANKNTQTVLAKAGAVSGTCRLREFTVIAGEPKTGTIHKEYGCQFFVDVARAYFSPRLSNEHHRVASLVKEGETVVDLFAGVGPFAIQIAKTHENVKVYAIDVNPDAIEYLKKNVRLNRVDGKIYPLCGDAQKVVDKKLLGIADRVIMNLPEKAMKFVDTACKAIRQTGGVVHFYCFEKASESLENAQARFSEIAEKSGKRVKILFSRSVRETAPYEWQIVLDAEVG